MKKRILAIVSAAVLALGCFTAVSAKSTDYLSKWEKALTLEGVVLADNDDLFTLAEVDDNDILARLAAQYPKAKPVRIFDLQPVDDVDEDDPLTIKVVDNDIKASKKYVSYHYTNKAGNVENGVWDATNVTITKIENGVLTLSVKKASPVAICTTSGAAASSAAAGTGAAGKTAAKTGEV